MHLPFTWPNIFRAIWLIAFHFILLVAANLVDPGIMAFSIVAFLVACFWIMSISHKNAGRETTVASWKIPTITCFFSCLIICLHAEDSPLGLPCAARQTLPPSPPRSLSAGRPGSGKQTQALNRTWRLRPVSGCLYSCIRHTDRWAACEERWWERKGVGERWKNERKK